MIRLPLRRSTQARWSRRVAVFAVPVIVLTTLLHRFGQIETAVGLVLLGLVFAMALVAVGLGFWGLVDIWERGGRGWRNAFIGIFLSLAILAWPSWHLVGLATLPRLNDITTDWQQPPSLRAAAEERPDGALGDTYRSEQVVRQVAAYPEIVPLFLDREPEQVFEAALALVEQRGWRVLAEQPPTENAPGRIEAVARTLVFGFEDDVVLRVTPRGQDSARVDMRSVSRYGGHDLGANAERIYYFLTELRAFLSLELDVAPIPPEEDLDDL